MRGKVDWSEYDDVEDIAVRLNRLLSSISAPDPVTGCCTSSLKGKHKQGYTLINALWPEDRGLPHPKRAKMVTGHRVLARLKFKQALTFDNKVYHTCGNMSCMNIDHLELGDFQDMGYNRWLRRSHNSLVAKTFGRQLTIAEMKWMKNHSMKECLARWPQLTREAVHTVKSNIVHSNTYAWLDRYDDNGDKI